MSIVLMTQLWESKDEYLRESRLLVMLCLADHVRNGGNTCFPSVTRMHERTRLSRRMVMRCILDLESKGYIKVDRQPGGKNHYTILSTGTTQFTSTSDMDSTTTSVTSEPDGTTTGDIRGIELVPPSSPESVVTVIKSEGKSKPAKKKAGSRPPTATYALAEELASVCKMEFAPNKGYLLREAKLLLEAREPPPTPELLLEHYGDGGWWWRYDWRGKRNELPQPSTIRKTWGQWDVERPAEIAAEVH